MRSKEPLKPIQVFSGTFLEAKMVKNFLERVGIESFLYDEFMGSIAPWYTAPGGAGAVKVVVSERDSEAARLAVEKYEEGKD